MIARAGTSIVPVCSFVTLADTRYRMKILCSWTISARHYRGWDHEKPLLGVQSSHAPRHEQIGRSRVDAPASHRGICVRLLSSRQQPSCLTAPSERLR